MKTRDKTVIFLAIFALFTCLADGAEPDHVRKVLVLNSYHPTHDWTETVVKGVESTLQQYEGKIEMDIGYMDTRYFYDERHYENLYALYKNKARRRQYDVVIASDNYALLFLLRYRDELYPNVPIVFCGVDRYHGCMLESQPREFDIDSLLRDQDFVTGVIESLDHESSVEIALKLHPSAKRVIVVHDGISDQMYWPAISKEVVQKFSGRVELVSLLLTDPTFGGLLEEIERTDDESIVYFADTFRYVGADLYFSEDELEMLRQRCTAPIYALTERWFGYNLVIGGKINSGFHQGQAAAKMVMRILDGDSVRNIPILWEGPTRYMFDYIQMKRFGISTADLPEGSIVINEPKSFYYLHKRQIWAVTAVIAALTVMVIILSANVLRRRQAEKKLFDYQRQLKSLASELSLTEERERRRIATDLHDQISQSLVISKVKLEALRESASLADVVKVLDEVCSSLDQTIQNTRSLTSDLSSPILYELGFEAAVAEWLAEQIRQRHGIETKFEDDGQFKPLDDDVCALLFRNVRELLINVVKHAQAHKVKVSIWRVNSEVHVSVEDDGVGFNLGDVTSAAARTGGFGLFSIRERLEQLGGHLEIESKRGHGTTVTVTAPLKDEKDQNSASDNSEVIS